MRTGAKQALLGVLLGLLLVSPSAVSEHSGEPSSHPEEAPASNLGLTPAEQRWLATHQDLRLGVDPAWAPFEFIDSAGRYSGMAAGFMALLSEMLGVRMQPVKGLSWSEVIEGAKRGDIDLLPCVVETPPRRDYLEFTQTYLDFPMVIVTRDDASFISGLSDLHDQRIGVVKGYASVDLIRLDYPDLELVEFATLDEGLEILSLGQIDAFVDNLATIAAGIKRASITNVKVAAQTPFSFKLAIGVRKDWPELVGILNKALAAITTKQADHIQNRWIRIKFEHGVDLPLVGKVALISSLIVALVVLIIFTWNRRLVAEVARRTQVERTLALRNQTLEQLSEERTLSEILAGLVAAVETDIPGSYGAIVLRDHQGGEPVKVVAPSLPIEYFHPFAGLAAAAGMGGRGQDVFVDTPRVIEDLRGDENWNTLDGLVGDELHACWSQPIVATGGAVLGSFTVYRPEPGASADRELQLLEEVALQAATAVEHHASAASLRKLSLAVEHSPNAVMITDRHGLIEYTNPRFSEISGFEADEVSGRSPRLLQDENDADGQRQALWAAVEAGQSWSGESRLRHKSGASYWAHELVSPMQDGKGATTHFVWLQEDITEAREVSERVTYQASHDSLTGLLNRREFERRLNHAWRVSTGDRAEHTLCFLDLDQFKVVNDTAGHVAGDELLCQVAQMLGRGLRRQDSLSRFGGDEFAILMEYCSVERAREKCEEFCRRLEQFRFSWEERSFAIGVSIGLVAVDPASGSASDALRHADIACYAAKDAGRSRVHVYQADDEVTQARSGEMVWATRIGRALESDGFTLFVQPVVPISGPELRPSYEVLIRMVDGDGTLLPPGAFLPAAERYNLVTRIDRWVVDALFQWLDRHPAVLDRVDHFAINLSGQSVGDAKLLTHLLHYHDSRPRESGKIRFEITETAAMGNLRSATQFISTLRERGTRFALDDFGSGLSSFGYLKNLDVDVLKIDGMFVRDMLSDPINAAMVKSINEIGHVMGKETVAEFVENTAILKRLQEMGVDYAQGYGIGKPMPIDVLQAHLEHREAS